jgi:hypothetical protein
MSDTTPVLSPEEEAVIDATIAAVIEAGSDLPPADTEPAPVAPAPAKKPRGKKKDEAPAADAAEAEPEAVDDQALPENVEVEDLPAPATNATVVDVATKAAKRKAFVWVVTYAHDDGREVVLEYDNLNTYKVKKGARALLMTGDRPMEA